MSALIDEFWIFSKKGEPFVHFIKPNKEDPNFDYIAPDLENPLLTKIQNIISEQIKEKKIKKLIKFNNENFNFAQCLKNDSVIFYKTKDDAKEKEIKNVCKIVGKIFEDAYRKGQLKVAKENIDMFDKFQKKLSIYSKLSNL
ncbi:MAG: hypothetical protein P8Y70_02965 [Candidatus Lokiarchaeota archaeon]